MNNMEYEKINDEAVRSAFIAWNNRDRDAFLNLISNDTTLTHNGEDGDITAFADEFFFGPVAAVFTGILHTADEGRTVHAYLESGMTGKVEVLMRFEVEQGKILHLDAGRP